MENEVASLQVYNLCHIFCVELLHIVTIKGLYKTLLLLGGIIASNRIYQLSLM